MSATGRIDHWQQRHRPVAIAFAVLRKFLEDGANTLGVQVAYWGFFSVFALLLLFASILGFVLQGDPALQRELVNSTLERMPVVGPQISGHIGTLSGSGAALVVGLVAALWTGLGVTAAIGGALDRLWAVPRVARAGFFAARLRGLLVLVSFGTINVLATVAVGVATAGGVGGTGAQVLGLLASAVIDVALFLTTFRLLTAAEVTTRQVLPGALLASACWFGLQALGGVFITQVLAGSSQTYGGFAAVVGLLTWLLLASQLVLLAAELNVVLARGLWPRSLGGPLLEADRRALGDAARADQMDPREHISVSFGPEVSPPPGGAPR